MARGVKPVIQPIRAKNYDFLNHKKDGEHAVEIVKILKEKGLTIDGCVTFWEDCGPLAATICDLLHLSGPGQQAAEIAKKKSWTHAILRTKTGDIPHFPRTCLYAAKCYHIKSESDIYNAINYIGIPAVLKLEYGSSAVGVKPIRDHTECKNIYQNIKTKLRSKPPILAFISINFGPVFVIFISTLNTPSTNPISVQHWYAAVTSCPSLSGKRQLGITAVVSVKRS
jgi:hypothetical protein